MSRPCLQSLRDGARDSEALANIVLGGEDARDALLVVVELGDLTAETTAQALSVRERERPEERPEVAILEQVPAVLEPLAFLAGGDVPEQSLLHGKAPAARSRARRAIVR